MTVQLVAPQGAKVLLGILFLVPLKIIFVKLLHPSKESYLISTNEDGRDTELKGALSLKVSYSIYITPSGMYNDVMAQLVKAFSDKSVILLDNVTDDKFVQPSKHPSPKSVTEFGNTISRTFLQPLNAKGNILYIWSLNLTP
jgi:hypothetical protein